MSRPVTLVVALAAALTTLAVAASAPQAAGPPVAIAYARSEAAGGGVFVWERSGRIRLVARDGRAPAWSPDGRRIAFVARSPDGDLDLYVADADGARRGVLTRTAGLDETRADWSPDGRRLVVERSGSLAVIRADGREERSLGPGSEPDWSPDGTRIAFASERSGARELYVVGPNGRGLRRLTRSPGAESAPAWSPDGSTLAFVSDELGAANLWTLGVDSGVLSRLTNDTAAERSPTWVPDGRSILFVSTAAGSEMLWTVPATGGDPVAFGGPTRLDAPRWRPPISLELRPDLDQQAPTDLEVDRERGRFLLGFRSATDNVGIGPLVVVSSRASTASPAMNTTQRVRVAGGGVRAYRGVGLLRYTYSASHDHWHLMGFQRYELRRAADHSLVARDRKAGFCLTDRWGNAAQGWARPRPSPVFTDYCARGNTRATAVYQGTSIGYSDVYPAHFHGQNIDITGVPAGEYVLVHRASPNLLIRELRYENNAASLRIRLTWPRGRSNPPRVHILRRCPAGEVCAA